MSDWAADAAKQAQEMADASQQARENRLREIEGMGASRDLAEYLLKLEYRIAVLEKGNT